MVTFCLVMYKHKNNSELYFCKIEINSPHIYRLPEDWFKEVSLLILKCKYCDEPGPSLS